PLWGCLFFCALATPGFTGGYRHCVPSGRLKPKAYSLKSKASSLQPQAYSLKPKAYSLKPKVSGLQPDASSRQLACDDSIHDKKTQYLANLYFVELTLSFRSVMIHRYEMKKVFASPAWCEAG
ncbi:MAG: hypothetical protein FWD31_03255, partial [Planctomycetaceae bacterium]|nr:hypothetical protein [Planctomycetaceae bacterium]